MKKYNIVCVNADYATTITETHTEHKDAVDSLGAILDKYTTEEKKKFFTVYFESSDELTIKYNGYMGKSLHAKYFIIAYEDDTATKKPLEFIKSKV